MRKRTMQKFSKTISPRENFDLYVNENWMNNNPIPEKYSKWGSIELLYEENLQKLKKIIEDDKGKLARIYKEFLDEDKLDKLDSNPIRGFINEIDYCINKEALWELLAKFYKSGVLSIFSLCVQEDAKNSKLIVPYLCSGGLGLQERDYYFDNEKQEMRAKYLEYIENCWSLYFSTTKKLKHILKIETELAKNTYTGVEKRDPEKVYNKMTIEELQETSPLDWSQFFSNITTQNLPYLIVDNPGFYSNLQKLWNNIQLEDWKEYFKIKVICNFSAYLSKRFYVNKFNFYSKFLSGQKVPAPKWERAIGLIGSVLGEQLGKKYVKKHFPESARRKMLELIYYLKESLRDRLLNLNWMSKDTKKRALKKISSFKAKIGYPSKWHDFDKLRFEEKDNLIEMLLKIRLFTFKYEADRLFKTTDPDRWEVNPHTINAFFNATKNEIVFPAGILQKPFFDPDGDEATNFGAIGAVIGHEMTHSFDDKGSQFDHKGNLNNWWHSADRKKFKEKAKYYEKEYARFKINGENVDGKLTLGENLADHGGVKIAYHAMEKYMKENKKQKKSYVFTQQERFFISWAIVWRCNIRPQEADRRLKIDPHSPQDLRINVTLANLPEFHKVFGVVEGDPMYRKDSIQMW